MPKTGNNRSLNQSKQSIEFAGQRNQGESGTHKTVNFKKQEFKVLMPPGSPLAFQRKAFYTRTLEVPTFDR